MSEKKNRKGRKNIVWSITGTRDLAGTRHGVLGREPEFEPRARAPLSADPFFDDEDTVFDSRGQRTSRLRRLPLGEDFANEVSATTRKLKARVSAIDADMESESRARASKFENDFMERTKAVLEDADNAFKRRPKFDHELPIEEKPSLTRWSKLLDSPEPVEDLGTGAAGRALRSKARLADLESEMEEMAEKQAKRERRAAALRALVSENSEDRSLASQASKISIRSEKHVTF